MVSIPIDNSTVEYGCTNSDIGCEIASKYEDQAVGFMVFDIPNRKR